MNKRKQSGSAHIIVIVILVIALMSALGFIFWQNFIDNSNDKKAETSQNSELKADEEIALDDKSKNNFDIQDWGIAGNYDGNYSIRYEIDSSTLLFKSDDLIEECKNYVISSIKKMNGDEVFPQSMIFPGLANDERTNAEVSVSGTEVEKSFIKKLGEYYYILIPSHLGCPGEDRTADIDLRSLFESLVLR